MFPEALAKRVHEINHIVRALLGRRRFLDGVALGLAPDQLLERVLVFVFELARIEFGFFAREDGRRG
jgi:hypothetical protein